MNYICMEDNIIKVVIPTDEQIAQSKEYGVDLETELIKCFAEELHERLRRRKSQDK